MRSSAGARCASSQLLRTGVLKLVVPAGLLAAGPYDPSTPVLAESAPFTVTIS
jgi:hypothetical protein